MRTFKSLLCSFFTSKKNPERYCRHSFYSQGKAIGTDALGPAEKGLSPRSKVREEHTHTHTHPITSLTVAIPKKNMNKYKQNPNVKYEKARIRRKRWRRRQKNKKIK